MQKHLDNCVVCGAECAFRYCSEQCYDDFEKFAEMYFQLPGDEVVTSSDETGIPSYKTFIDRRSK